MITVHGCRILVKPIKIEEKDEIWGKARASGLYIPEKTERQEQSAVESGTIIAMGSLVSEQYVEGIKVGDQIGFAKYGGKFVTDPETDEMLLVINDEDVVCGIKKG